MEGKAVTSYVVLFPRQIVAMLRTPTVATVQYADVKKVCRAKKLLEYT
jgi:hypothetical protein